MDTTKQPGIIIKNIILINDQFSREAYIPEGARLNINFHQDNKIFEEEYSASLTAELTLSKDDKVYLDMKTTFVGIFAQIINEKNMDMNNFIKNHAPAIILPYIREHVTTLTQKSGIGPIIIPPINIIALLNKSSEQNKKDS